MLDAYRVTESNWRDATKIPPHFAISETLLSLAARRPHSLRIPTCRVEWEVAV